MTTTSSSIFYLADPEYSLVLDPLALMVQERLSLWFGQEDYLAQLAIPFGATAGTEAWQTEAETLRQSILNGTYSIRLEVRSSEELGGAQGAYSATGTTGQPTIYLNGDWLNTASQGEIQAVLLEELGHSFDQVLNNGVDSQGDEGEIFANLVLNTGANTASLLQQNDHYTVTIGGQPVAIEAAAWGSANVAQTFYLPMAENDVRSSLFKISSAVGNDIRTVISLVATSNGTVIVYDHWEDGYEADINNPTQATTQIWGDGNVTNGAAPGDADDVLARGQVITLINTININSLSTVDYDGRDRIGATQAISVTKAGWATSPGTVLAGAINIYDVGNSGKSYVIPVGQNTVTNNASPNDTANRLFEYTSLHIIAYENGTTVNIDLNGDGDTSDANELVVNLSQGQSYLVNGNVLAGTKVTSNKAIGVYSIAGDVGSSYENRWLAITPTEQWYNSYFAPVSTTRADSPAHVFLYNPSSSAITVTYDTQTTKGATVVVPAKGNAYVVMPASAAHFYTVGGENFFAISTIDSDATANQSYDWSYSLVPESYLTDKFVVAWGPGYNNTDGAISTAKNGSPVWVTAPKDTTIYIDYAGNGWNAGQGDITYNLKALESYRITDSDKDQSGLTVYTLDGTLITAAWGEDPSVADAGNPYLDMGTTVLPFPDYVFQKVSKEASTLVYGAGVSDNDTNVELGEQIEYTVSVTNRAVIDLFNINIKDSIAPSTSATYVPNSTVFTIYDPNGNIVISSVLGGSGFPLGGAGYTITDADPNTPEIDGLKRGYKAVIKYRVEVRDDINSDLSTANYTITNNAKLTGNPSGGDPITKEITNETKVVVNSYDGEVSFYKSDFSAVATTFQEGNTIGIQVIDRDPNKTSTTAETLTVTVTNSTTGETELVTLTETGVNTGIFRGTLATSTTSSDNGNNSGKLYMVQGDSLKVEYTDPVFGSVFDNPTAPGIPQIADTTTTNPLLPSPGNNSDSDTSTATGKANTSTASVAVPTKTKILYLSADAADNDGTGDLDRINPADPDSNSSTSDPDTSLSSTTNITPAIAGTGGGTGTYRDNFSTAAYNNSNGTESWTTSWTEVGTGTDTDAGAGIIQINTSTAPTGLAFERIGTTNPANADVQRSLNLSSADTSQAITLSFTVTTLDSLGYSGTTNENSTEGVTLKISTDGGTTFNTITTGSFTKTSGAATSAVHNSGVFKGDDNGTGTYTVDIKNLIAIASNKNNIIIQFDGNSLSRTTASDPLFSVDDFLVSFTKTGTPATPAVPATFTQSISMADAFAIPAGGEIKVITYISGLTGGTPTSGNITAALTYGASGTGSSLITLTTFTYTDTGSGTGFITWTGTVPSGVTIPAGQKVQLVVTNNQLGLSFKADYDSNTKPSRIELPTTTVIDIEDVDNNAGNGVREIGFYDKSFANNGSLITSGTIDAGQIVYLRVRVSDPFGDYDITGLTITINGPGTDGDQTVALTNANVINAAGDGGAIKTYEYAWQTLNNTGVYNITVTAKEGSEGITATATSSFIVTAQDLGTPSTTEFVDINGNIVNQYTAGATAYLQVTDMDEGGSGTIKANVQINGGAFYEVTLTETATPGIFRVDLSDETKFTVNPGTSPFQNLPGNAVLNANYVDNDDATDTSNDTISVGNQPPTLDLDPTNGNTVNNTASFDEGTATGVAFTQTGQSIADDSGNLANLKISFLTASISDGANEKLQFNGATAGGVNITSLDLNFSTGGTNTVLIGGVTYLITRTVDLGTGLSTLTFTNNAGGNLTVAQTETLLDSLRYFNSSANPTDGNREFTAIVNDGSLNSNSTTFTVDVNPVNDAPAGANKGFNLASNSSITLTVSDFGFTDPNDSPANNLQAVKISSLPTNGTLYYNGVAITPAQITAGYFVSVNDINAGKLTYTANSSSSSFTFQVQDDGGTANGGVDLDQSPNTITFTVAPNVPPVVDLDPANATLNNTATFTEMLGADTGVNAIRFSLDTGTEISITDTDSPNLANLKVSIAQSQIASGDQLRFGNIIIDLTTDPDTTPTSGQVTYNGTVFGYVVSDDVSGNRIITFTSKAGIGGIDALAPKASYEALIDALKYNNTSDTPSGTRAFSVTANDGQADSVTPAIFTVTLQATPEPPVLDLDATSSTGGATLNNLNNTFTEGGSAVYFAKDANLSGTPHPSGTNLSDPDSANLTQLKITVDNASPLQTGDQIRVGTTVITGNGTINVGGVDFSYSVTGTNTNGDPIVVTFSNTATKEQYEALLEQLNFYSTSANPTGTRNFAVTVTDDTSTPSAPANFAVSLVPVNTPPIVDLDTTDGSIVIDRTVGWDSDTLQAINFTTGATNLTDLDSEEFQRIKVSFDITRIPDGDLELIQILGATSGDSSIELGSNGSGSFVLGTTTYNYQVTTDDKGTPSTTDDVRTITFTRNSGNLSKTESEALLDALQYNNTDTSPDGTQIRVFNVEVTDDTNLSNAVLPKFIVPFSSHIVLDLDTNSPITTPNIGSSANSQATFTEGDNPVPFTYEDQDPSLPANLVDPDHPGAPHQTFEKLRISTFSGIPDGVDETLRIIDGSNNTVLSLALNFSDTTPDGTFTFGGVTYKYELTTLPSGTETLRRIEFSRNDGQTVPQTVLEQLIDALHYNNASQDPTAGDRVFFVAPFDGTNFTNIPTFTATVVPVNDPPVLDLDGTTATGGSTLNHTTTFTEVAGTDTTGANAVNFAKLGSTTPDNVRDVDSPTLSNFKVSINTSGVGGVATGDQLILGGTVIDITNTSATGEVTYNGTVFGYSISDASGVRTITFTSLTGSNGTASPAAIASYEALVDALKYNNTSDSPSGSRTFTNTVTDSGNLTSAPAQFTVTLTDVPDDFPPVAVNDSLSANEDTPRIITPTDLFGSDGTGNNNDSDVDSANFASITVTELATNGTLEYFNGSTWVAVTDEQVITVADLTGGKFRFVPTADYNGSANFKYKVSDGAKLSNEATVTITVSAVNDPPVLDLDGSTSGFDYSTAYAGGSTGIAIADSDNSITDVDDTHIESATIILTNAKTGDVLNVPTIAGLTFNVNTATPGQIAVTVTGSKTLDEYETAIRQITFANPDINLDTTPRTITVQVNDGNNNSNLATTTIAVSQSNQPPTLDLDPNDPLATSANNAGTFTENGAIVRFTKDAVAAPTSIDDSNNTIEFLEISFANSGANSIQDGSNEQIRIAGTVGLVGGSIALNFANNAPIPDIVLGGITYNVAATVSGTTSTLRFTKYDGTDLTTAQAETLLDALGYYNSSENPTSGQRVFTAIVNDGFVNSNSAAFTVNVTPVNDAPSFTVATGKVVTDIGTNTIDKGHSVYLQPDGKILVGGQSDAGGNFALVRYNSDGSLDTSFGTGGKITADFVAPDDDSIFVQPDGKILAAGYKNGDIVVTRYNSNGTLDTSFGSGGRVTTNVGTNTIDFAFTLFVQADGKIVVSGESDNDFATVRYNSNGTLDASFGGGTGKVVTHVGSAGIDTDRAYSTFVQADGKIVVTGYSNTDFALVRYNSDGTLDTTFDGDGKVLTDLGSTDIGYSAFSQPDGKIILAGESNNNFALVRYNSNGSLDTSFGTGGKVITDINGSNDSGRGVFVTQDGKILLAGEANSTLNSFALVRYNSDGTLDNSFGTGGKVITDIDNGSFDYAFSIFVQPDGKIIVVGESDDDFATVRYNSDGTLDTTFGAQVSTLDNNPTYSFGGSPVVLDGSVTVSDPELTARNNWGGATLTLQRNGGANAGDVFGDTTALAALGTLTNTGGTLSITFNNGVTNAQVQTAIQQITYSNTEVAPAANVTINYTLNDQNSNTGGSGTAGSGQDQGTGGRLTGLGSITVDILKGVNDTGSATEAGGINNGTPGSNATGNVLINASAANTTEAGDDIYETPASLTVTGIRTGSTEGSGTAGTLSGSVYTLVGTYGTLTINTDGSYTYVVDDSDPDVEALNAGQSLQESFNYSLSAGGATDIAVLTITINGSNDNQPPTLDLDPNSALSGTFPNFGTTDDNSVVFTENGAAVAFTLSPGSDPTSIDDDGDTIAWLKVSFDNTSSNIRDGAAEQILVNGGTQGISPANIALNFADSASITNIVLGGVTYTVAASVVATTSTLTFSKDGGGNLTKLEAEALLDALRYQVTGDNPTDGNRIFNLQVNDGTFNSNTATLTVDVNPVNDAPVALDDAYTISESGYVVGNMIYGTGTIYNGLGEGTPALDGADDSDVDDPLTSLTITQIIDTTTNASGPVNILYTIVPGVEKIIYLVSGATLKVRADGTFDYNPNTIFRFLQNGQSVVEDFTYTLTDPHGATDTAVVSITINGTNDPPNATNDTFETAPDTNLGGNVITANNGNGADSDPDGDRLTVTALNGSNTIGYQVILTSGALLTLNSNGTFTYNSNGYSGNTDTFNYTITDEGGNTDTATVTIKLQAPSNGRTALYPGGTDAADNIAGTSGGDLISGGGNTDTIYGNAGSDEIYGDAGNDTLYGGTENDLLFGGDGSDVIYGDEGDDYIHGSLGADTINGGPGRDFLDYRSPTDSVWTYYRTTSADTLNSFNAAEDTFIVSRKPDAFVSGSLKTGTTPPTAYTITYSARPTDSQIATLLTAAKLPVNNAAFFYWKTSSTATSWKTYMVLNDGVAGYQANTTTAVSSDIIIDVSNYAGTISLNTFKTWAQATDKLDSTNTWAIQDGPVNLLGGFGIDTLIGGGLGDRLIGAGGADILTGGAGADKFDYRKLADSLLGTTPSGYDYITDFNASEDLFLVNNTVSVFTPGLSINTTTYTTLTAAAIQSVLNTTNFAANSAASFAHGNDTFIAINDATAGYSVSTDALIKVTGYSGTFGVEDFTTVF